MKLEYHDINHFRCNDLHRWKLQVGNLFSVRLHHWVKGDPPAYQHAHPWWFVTIVLRGGYEDVVLCGQCNGEPWQVDHTGAWRYCKKCGTDGYLIQDVVRAPAVRFRNTNYRHAVVNTQPNTWSIVITGRAVKNWRFWMGAREVSETEWNEREC